MSNDSQSPKERRFVAEYLKDQNGTQAAIRAGYSPKTANEQGSRLLAKVHISGAIDEALRKIEDESAVTVERVRSALVEMAEADPLSAFNDDGTLKPLNKIPKAVRMLLSGIELDGTRGELVKLRFSDRTRVFELLGKHLRMFTDLHELTGKKGSPLVPASTPIDFSKWSKDEIIRALGDGHAH